MGQRAASNQDDVLLIEAHAADIAHNHAHQQMLESHKAAAQAIENGNHNPGNVADMPKIQPGNQHQQAYPICQQNRKLLLTGSAVPLGYIHTQHVEQNQLRTAVKRKQLHVFHTAQIDAPGSVHHTKADSDGGEIRQNRQKCIAEQMDHIQDSLILFDHLSPPRHFRTRNNPPFFSQFCFSRFTTGSSR